MRYFLICCVVFYFRLLHLAGDEVKELKGRVGPAGKGKDRKSPNTIQNDTADSDEDKKSNELKVPPLKIVLSNSNEVDTNVR